MARTAIWRDIAASLQAEITSGRYLSGDKLPTEAELARRFGVNRHTVRHALSLLAEEGQVHSRRGAGVFVANRMMDYPLGQRVRFHQNVLESGRTPSRRVTRLETSLAEPREAEALGLAKGDPVHLLEGVSLVDDAPVAAFRSVFPAARFPGLPASLARQSSVTTAFAENGLTDYTRAETRITASRANSLLALTLHLREGDPLLRSVAINVDLSGIPIEFGTTWFAGERVTLTVTPEQGLSQARHQNGLASDPE